MFQKKPEVTAWACGDDCAAFLVGGRVRWYRALGETSRYAVEADLPKGWGVGDVAALHAAPSGVSVVAKDGRVARYDLNRREWALFGNGLVDGTRP